MCFSWITFILPLVGAFFSLPVSMSLICLLFVSKALLGFGVMTMGLPTMVAALSWSEKMQKSWLLSFALNVLLPFSCIILFVLHPVAGKAFAYSFYWFIPVVVYFLKSRTNFGVALSSTFLAHAVGSIIWLYSVPMTYGQWNALILVVAAERLVMACAMTFAFYALKKTYAVYTFRTDTQDQDSYDKQYLQQAYKALDHSRP